MERQAAARWRWLVPRHYTRFFPGGGLRGISRTLKANVHDAGVVTQNNDNMKKKIRIRKLTPTECLRLMDVSDMDIDVMLGTGVSNTQLYKQAGNSIVVSCLYHIFRKMFVETGKE